MATIADLEDLGYDVDVAFEGDGFTVYRVEGFGLSTMARGDDEDALQSYVDSHDERAKQTEETRSETMLRHADDPDHPFELDDDHRASLERQAVDEREAREASQQPAA